MSSLTRTIQCYAEGAMKFARRHFGGRGSKLGVANPKDPCRTGSPKKPKAWRAKGIVPAKPRLKSISLGRRSKVELVETHRTKMLQKHARPSAGARRTMLGHPAGTNRHTGKPHNNRRQSARRLRQLGGV